MLPEDPGAGGRTAVDTPAGSPMARGTTRPRHPSARAGPRPGSGGRPRRRAGSGPSPRQQPVGCAAAPRNALEKDLPGARKCPNRKACANSGPRSRSAPREAGSSRRRGNELEAGNEMGERREVGQDHRRVGAGVVVRAQARRKRPATSPRMMRLEQVDDLGPVGEAQHRREPSSAVTCPAAVGDRLIEQGERVARRTFGRARDQRQRLRLDAARLPQRRSRPDASPARRLRSGAGRSAGSATGSSPEPCGSRWWRR